MKLNITDIILIILIIGVLYLLFSTDKEDFTNDIDIINAVEEEINKRYSVDLTNMRNLSNFIINVSKTQDEFDITQTNIKIFDLNTNDTNINSGLKVTGTTTFESDATIEGTYVHDVDKLKLRDVRVKGEFNINAGKFNDIFPTGSIILFYTGFRQNNNIPYGWVPCDGSYYDIVQAQSDESGKDQYGNYSRFYKKSDNQPTLDNSLKRNLDLAHTQNTFNPTIQDLLRFRNIGLQEYIRLNGVINKPFNENDLSALRIWDEEPGNGLGEVLANEVASKSTKKGLSSDPIKRDYIYIRKII